MDVFFGHVVGGYLVERRYTQSRDSQGECNGELAGWSALHECDDSTSCVQDTTCRIPVHDSDIAPEYLGLGAAMSGPEKPEEVILMLSDVVVEVSRLVGV